jgi:hypothetical protein
MRSASERIGREERGSVWGPAIEALRSNDSARCSGLPRRAVFAASGRLGTAAGFQPALAVAAGFSLIGAVTALGAARRWDPALRLILFRAGQRRHAEKEGAPTSDAVRHADP